MSKNPIVKVIMLVELASGERHQCIISNSMKQLFLKFIEHDDGLIHISREINTKELLEEIENCS